MTGRSTSVVGGETISNLPWQERPDKSNELIWRYSENPLFGFSPVPDNPNIYTIYNSAPIPFQGGFAGVFRADHRTGLPYLHVGHSADGIAWDINPDPLAVTCGIPGGGPAEFAYDPRVLRMDDTYYVMWCNDYHGPTIGIATTKDFVNFDQKDNAFLPCNRNGVLFPRKINGHFAMLSRPSDMGHTPFGEIFYSESPDLKFWGNHRFVMGRGDDWWSNMKVGPGPAPIETTHGWLMIYHGVVNGCNGYVYRMGLALLDPEEPWKVIHRSPNHVFGPEAAYETAGAVPNVVFPCAALCDAATGRVAIYYGAADTDTGLAFAHIDELIAYVLAE